MKNYLSKESFKKAFSKESLKSKTKSFLYYAHPILKIGIFYVPISIIIYLGFIKYPYKEIEIQKQELLSEIPPGWKFVNETFTYISDNITENKNYITKRNKGKIFIYNNYHETYLAFESVSEDVCSKSEAFLLEFHSLKNNNLSVKDNKIYILKEDVNYENPFSSSIFLFIYSLFYVFIYFILSRYLFKAQRSDKTRKISNFFIWHFNIF